MTAAAIWVLLAVSTGMYNQGNISPVREFPSQESCEVFKQSLNRLVEGRAKLECIEERLSAGLATKNASEISTGDLLHTDKGFIRITRIVKSPFSVYVNSNLQFDLEEQVTYVK